MLIGPILIVGLAVTETDPKMRITEDFQSIFSHRAERGGRRVWVQRTASQPDDIQVDFLVRIVIGFRVNASICLRIQLAAEVHVLIADVFWFHSSAVSDERCRCVRCGGPRSVALARRLVECRHLSIMSGKIRVISVESATKKKKTLNSFSKK